MLDAARTGDLERIKEFYEQGHRPYNKRDRLRRTPFHIAVIAGHLDCVKYFLSRCLKEYNLTRIEDNDGRTAILLACSNKTISVEILEALIQADAESAGKQDRHGANTLHAACDNDNQQAAELLVNAGINLDLQNNLGQSALHIAATKRSLAIIEMLLYAGADTSLVDNEGNLALVQMLRYARRSGAGFLRDFVPLDDIFVPDYYEVSYLAGIAKEGFNASLADFLSKRPKQSIRNLEFAFWSARYQDDCAKILLKAMNRNHIKYLDYRENLFVGRSINIAKITCEIVPELFIPHAVKYLLSNWETHRKGCVEIIQILLSQVSLDGEEGIFFLTTGESLIDIVNTFLFYGQDVTVLLKNEELIHQNKSLSLFLYGRMNLMIIHILLSISPRYSPIYLIREDKLNLNKLDPSEIPKNWELNLDESGRVEKHVESLKHIARLGLPESLQLYMRYSDNNLVYY